MQQLNREGASFRRQVAIDDYVYDFGEFRSRLLVELDGVVHRLDDVVLRDAKRSEYAQTQGFRLLRLTNNEVWSNPDSVFDKLRAARAAPSSLAEEVSAKLTEEGRSGGTANVAADGNVPPHPDSPPPLAPPRKGEGNT